MFRKTTEIKIEKQTNTTKPIELDDDGLVMVTGGARAGGVDEPDLTKTDGQFIWSTSSR